jgi:hypothetical protein
MPIRKSSISGGLSTIGFNLDVGSSGNTTFVLPETKIAGKYSITSYLADTTVEFYLIAEDDTLAGYSASKGITATKDFNKVIVYGAATNDRISFDYEPVITPLTSGDQDSGAAPFITAVSDADLANIDDTTIITGGNFATDVVVTFTGTDLTVLSAKALVRTDSTQLIVTRPDGFLPDNAPYTLTVSNPGIVQSAFLTYTSSITAGGNPTWITPAGSLTGAYINIPYSETLQATDPDNGNIEYNIPSGSLPAGLTLNSSTGEISGTTTLSESQSFTVSATDLGGNSTNRSFSILSSEPYPSSMVLHLDAANSISYSGSGSTWYDISGNNRNGTLVNATYDANGYFNFNGSNTYVDLTNTAFVGSGNSPLTAELWVYVGNSLTTNTYIMPIRVRQDSEFFVVIGDNAGTFYSNIVFRGNTQWGLSGQWSRANLENQWIQLVARYNGGDKNSASSYNIFRNGVNLGSGSINYGGAGGSSNYNVLGKDSNSTAAAGGTGNGALNGRVAIYRLYDQALTDSQVSDLYDYDKTRFGLS